MAPLHVTAGRLQDARQAFERASSSAIENRAALRSLAIVQLQTGEGEAAVEILTRLASAAPRDVQLRLTLAQALVATGKPAQAAQELDEAQAIAPADPELLFALASGYLRVKKVEAAEVLFARVVKARPLPETHVLIGRTYRDFQYYDRARSALRAALKMDPRVRRAHYYLGTSAILEEGSFASTRRSPSSAKNCRLRLTIRWQRCGSASSWSRRAAMRKRCLCSRRRCAGRRHRTTPGCTWDAVSSALGRAGRRGRLPEARARHRCTGGDAPGSADVRRRSVHYQLATALRATGATAEAEREFAEAQRLSVEQAESERDQLSQVHGGRTGDTGCDRARSAARTGRVRGPH